MQGRQKYSYNTLVNIGLNRISTLINSTSTDNEACFPVGPVGSSDSELEVILEIWNCSDSPLPMVAHPRYIHACPSSRDLCLVDPLK